MDVIPFPVIIEFPSKLYRSGTSIEFSSKLSRSGKIFDETGLCTVKFPDRESFLLFKDKNEGLSRNIFEESKDHS